jgi:membrane-associated phospholipid phosphatase
VPSGTYRDIAGIAARRLAIATGVLALAAVGFEWTGTRVSVEEARTLRTAVDDAIPFLPWTVYLYSWVYTSMLYPLFVVRDEELFRRTAIAFALTIAGSMVCFVAFPVTSIGLRPDVGTLDATRFDHWAVLLTYWVDPPFNLFPSMHLAAALVAGMCTWKARVLFGIYAFAVAAAVGVSILTMKQHYLADGIGAIALAVAIWALVLRTYDPRSMSRHQRAFPWQGAALYFAFHATFYAAFYVAFRLGAAPWLHSAPLWAD